MEKIKSYFKDWTMFEKKLAVNFKCDNGGIITYVGR